MGDLFLSEASTAPLLRMSIHHMRVLTIIARGHGQFVKLPLRFKFDHQLVDELVVAGIIERGDSGWPGVPAYRLTPVGNDAKASWLSSQSLGAGIPYR